MELTQLKTYVPVLKQAFPTYQTDYLPEHDIFVAESRQSKMKFVFSSFEHSVVVDCYHHTTFPDEHDSPGVYWSAPQQQLIPFDKFNFSTVQALLKKQRIQHLFQ